MDVKCQDGNPYPESELRFVIDDEITTSLPSVRDGVRWKKHLQEVVPRKEAHSKPILGEGVAI